jgi:hypothetical protein
MKTRLAFLCALALLLCSCGGSTPGGKSGGASSGNKGGSHEPERSAGIRSFPEVSAPSVFAEDQDAAREYVLEHYWDAFFKGDWPTTLDRILGVEDAGVEQALSNYIQILILMKERSTPDSPAPFNMACKSVQLLFSKLEAKQLADTSAKTYLRFTEKVSKYLYDPNSPMRDEDFYLPFVEGMTKSPCTRPDMRNAYLYEARQCRTNSYGKTVPNFSFKDARGNKSSLYSHKADYVMLFFSNPGCSSCKEIIDELNACLFIPQMIADKHLAVINIYIDEEVEVWRSYLHNYPSFWINGYDYTFSLRVSGGYDIRAIPSLYLLDAHKRVLLKDAPTKRVIAYLENIHEQ